MATVPTVANIREWSQLDFDDLNYGEESPDPLQIELDRAISYVSLTTGLNIADLTDGENNTLAFVQCIQMRVEQEVVRRQDDFVRDLNENAIDIAVTGYRQTRIKIDEQCPPDKINAWPELNDLMMQIMTDDRFDYWQDLGKIPGSSRPFEQLDDTEWWNC